MRQHKYIRLHTEGCILVSHRIQVMHKIQVRRTIGAYLRLISALAISDSEGSPLKVGGLVQWWGG